MSVRDETEVERLKRWHQEATLYRDALKLENEKLKRKVERMFYWACKASVALDNQDHEHAVDAINRAKFAANS